MDEERWAVAWRMVDKLEEHGANWKLDEKVDEQIDAHSTPQSFTGAHNPKPENSYTWLRAVNSDC
jgi:hypothetical protein